MTKPTIKDVVDGTREGQKAVQEAMERSAARMAETSSANRLLVEILNIVVPVDGGYLQDYIDQDTEDEIMDAIAVYTSQAVAEAEIRHKEDYYCRVKPKPNPYFHNHVCATCSPNGKDPGNGCINCRETGMDQTPCPDCPGPVREAQLSPVQEHKGNQDV